MIYWLLRVVLENVADYWTNVWYKAKYRARMRP
jgi:hypothetical protein